MNGYRARPTTLGWILSPYCGTCLSTLWDNREFGCPHSGYTRAQVKEFINHHWKQLRRVNTTTTESL